jgi:hypothetical protein
MVGAWGGVAKVRDGTGQLFFSDLSDLIVE